MGSHPVGLCLTKQCQCKEHHLEWHSSPSRYISAIVLQASSDLDTQKLFVAVS